MNAEPRFLTGYLDSVEPVFVTRMEPARAFDAVFVKLLRSYRQIERPDFPPRPRTYGQELDAGRWVELFACEAAALQSADAVEHMVPRDWRVRTASGVVTVGELLDFVKSEVARGLADMFLEQAGATKGNTSP